MAEQKGDSSISSTVTSGGESDNQEGGTDISTSEAMVDELIVTSQISNVNENDDTPTGAKSSISSTVTPGAESENQGGRDMTTSEAVDEESNDKSRTSNVNENDDTPKGAKSSISNTAMPSGESKSVNQAGGRDLTDSEAVDDESNETSQTSNVNENDDTPAGEKSSISNTAVPRGESENQAVRRDIATSEAMGNLSNDTSRTSNVNENDDTPRGEKLDDGFVVCDYSESEKLKKSDEAGANAYNEAHDKKEHSTSKLMESNFEGEKLNGTSHNAKANTTYASHEGVSEKDSQLESKPCVCSSCCSCFADKLIEISQENGVLKTEFKAMKEKLQAENESLGKRYEDLKQENCENIERINSKTVEIEKLKAEIQRLQKSMHEKDDNLKQSSKEVKKQYNCEKEKLIETHKKEIDELKRKYSDREMEMKNELAAKDIDIQSYINMIDAVQAEKKELDKELRKLSDESAKKEKELSEEIDVLKSKVKSLERKKPVDCGVPKNLFDDQRMTGILSQLQGFMSSDRGCIKFIPKDSEGILEDNHIIIPCINSSRVGSDISSALTNSGVMASGKKAILLVFNHQASHNARIVTPTRERLSDASVFTLCETIIDLVYWQGKMYECDANTQGISELKLRLGMQ